MWNAIADFVDDMAQSSFGQFFQYVHLEFPAHSDFLQRLGGISSDPIKDRQTLLFEGFWILLETTLVYIPILVAILHVKKFGTHDLA